MSRAERNRGLTPFFRILQEAQKTVASVQFVVFESYFIITAINIAIFEYLKCIKRKNINRKRDIKEFVS